MIWGLIIRGFWMMRPHRISLCQPARRLLCQPARRLLCQPARPHDDDDDCAERPHGRRPKKSLRDFFGRKKTFDDVGTSGRPSCLAIFVKTINEIGLRMPWCTILCPTDCFGGSVTRSHNNRKRGTLHEKMTRICWSLHSY